MELPRATCHEQGGRQGEWRDGGQRRVGGVGRGAGPCRRGIRGSKVMHPLLSFDAQSRRYITEKKKEIKKERPRLKKKKEYQS